MGSLCYWLTCGKKYFQKNDINTSASVNPGECNGKPPCEKFSQENYNGENTLHCNRRRSKPSIALEEEYVHMCISRFLDVVL